MAERSAGFYWVKDEDGEPTIARFDPATKYAGAEWCFVSSDDGAVSADEVPDADVLAGPLQAPEPEKSYADDMAAAAPYERRAEELIGADAAAYVHYDLRDWQDSDGCGVEMTLEQEASLIERIANHMARYLTRGPEEAGRVQEVLDESAERRWDALSGINSGAVMDLEPSSKTLYPIDAPLTRKIRNVPPAAAQVAALRLRARALLEGTTPGPWTLKDGSVFGSLTDDPDEDGEVIDDSSFRRTEDLDLILGAHALLTELAKEET